MKTFKCIIYMVIVAIEIDPQGEGRDWGEGGGSVWSLSEALHCAAVGREDINNN